MKKPSAVVDTNLFISALIVPKSHPSQLISLWRKNVFTLITSEPMIEELQDVLMRPKYTKTYGISSERRERLLKRIRTKARIVSTLSPPVIKIRDAKDLIVLATALDAKADFLITGDKDLLALKDKRPITPLAIVTIVEFIRLFEKENRF